MKIICTRENFKNAIFNSERVVSKQTTLPILNNILFETERGILKLSATNLEIGVEVKIGAKIEKEGRISIPARLLSNFVNNLPTKGAEENIFLETNEQGIKIKSGTARALIKGLPAGEFPLIPKKTSAFLIKLPGQQLKNAILQVINCAALNETRQELTGVSLLLTEKELFFAATDSFRLAEKTIGLKGKIKKEVSFILPQDAVRELINILSREEGYVVIYFSPNQILFENIKEETSHTQVQILSRLIEGEYPKYQEIIPKKYKTQIISKKDDLQNQLKQAGLFSGKISEVKLAVQPEDNRLKIYSESPEIGKNEAYLPVKIKGEAIEISFNYKFLILGLQNIRSSEVIFELNGEEGPGVLKPVGDESYIYISMPIKLS